MFCVNCAVSLFNCVREKGVAIQNMSFYISSHKLRNAYRGTVARTTPTHVTHSLYTLRALAHGMDPALARVARPTVCPRPDSNLLSRLRSIRLPRPLSMSVPPTISTPATSAPLRSIKLHAAIELRVDEPPFSSKQ
jgi:hypothetical protein